MNQPTDRLPIAILGLGPMGAAIARSLTAAGQRVAAWNRSSRDLDDIGGDPALLHLAASPEAAIVDARLVVVCVRDHAASRELVERIGPGIGHTVLVNLSTGTPDEAAESAARATAGGVRYVTGAVMVPTSMVGSDECTVLYAGRPSDLSEVEPLMAAMGGTSDIVGDDHGVPPALDLAMLDVYFAGLYAFLHSAALAGTHGIDPQRYLPYAENIVDTLRGSLPALGDAIERRSYDSGDARLDMCLAFLEHIVAASTEAGIDPGIAGLVRDASARAMSRWPASTDWDVVAEELLGART
jgi:3-hydroxyisobutyrate dehydrogenase-like beta-hydroxyacid dehydrogenase